MSKREEEPQKCNGLMCSVELKWKWKRYRDTCTSARAEIFSFYAICILVRCSILSHPFAHPSAFWYFLLLLLQTWSSFSVLHRLMHFKLIYRQTESGPNKIYLNSFALDSSSLPYFSSLSNSFSLFLILCTTKHCLSLASSRSSVSCASLASKR